MRPMNTGSGRGRGLLGPGPLMTGHLKVRNLDRELEMLRRKREIIQREQEILNMECNMERKRQYGQANRNVSNMHCNVWEPPPPKRANVPQQMQPWRDAPQNAFASHMPEPMPSNYIPSLMENKVHMPRQPVHSAAPILKPIIHPILQDGAGNRMFKPAPKAKNDYRSFPVPMKKKPQTPPNKLNSYPENVRKNLVSKASDKSAVGAASSDAESLVLREDQKPCQRVSGRLELVLGNVFKEIKQSYSDDAKITQLISTTSNQRYVKTEIRERIRSVMLNQTVNSVVDINNKFREKFPKETDKDIINLLINKVDRQKPGKVIETESPTDVFNKNFDYILDKKLRELSANLLKIYNNPHLKSTLDDARAADLNEKEENTQQAMRVLRSITNKYVTFDERNILTKYFNNLIEEILEVKLAEHLPKYKEQFMKIFKLDDQMMDVMAVPTKRPQGTQNEAGTVHLDKEKGNVTKPDAIPRSNEMGDEINKNEENMEKPSNENKEIQKKDVTQNGVSTKNGPDDNNPVQVETNKGKDLEATVADPIEAEQSPMCSANIEPETPVSNKIQAPVGTSEPTTAINKADTPSTSNAPGTPSTPLGKDLLYYIKLFGKPNLPTRPVICDFLNSYQPKSIKKHKSINNLLVIGFNDLNNYNQILKANETVVGDITIIIKGSEKVNAGKENESINKSNGVQKADGKEMNEKMPDSQNGTEDKEEKDGMCATIETSIDKDKEEKDGMCATTETSIDENTQKEDDVKDIIGKDLDDQITDLLSTIKETEETVTATGKPDNSSNVGETKEIELPEQSSESDNGSLATIKEDEVEVKNGDADKAKGAKTVATAAATPVRSSSRLANVTPCTIRTRRASRLLQE